jgi:hypothetical protein
MTEHGIDEPETQEQRRERRIQEAFERKVALEMSIEENEKFMKINHLSSNGANNSDLLMYMMVKQMSVITEELKGIKEALLVK